MKQLHTAIVFACLLAAGFTTVFAQTPDFSDTHDDGVLSGWTNNGARGWTEAGGAMVPQNNTGGSGFLISDFEATTDGVVEVDIEADQWNGNNGGLILRWTSPSSYYFVSVRPGNQWDNYIRLCKNMTNPDSGITVASKFPMSQNFTLRVELEGSTFRFFLDGELKGEIIDTDHAAGHFGYGYSTAWNSYTEFQEIRWWNAEPTDYPLNVTVDGSGSVEPAGGTFPAATEVELTATPEAGWRFVNWSGDIEGTDNPVVVTMDAEKNIVAHFEQITYSLSVELDGNGQVEPAGGDFPQGEDVTITATADAGWTFSHWSGDVEGNENPLVLTMDAVKNITAHFEQIMHPVAITVEGNGTVTPPGGDFAQGEEATFTATADSNWEFSHWSGDVESSENPLTIVIDAPKTLAAVFEEIIMHPLVVDVEGGGQVEPAGGEFRQEEPVTITATPDSAWEFSHWSGDIEGTVNPVTITMDSPKTVTAHFVPIPVYELTITSEGNGSVNPAGGTYLGGTELEITATPESGWVFSHWSGDVESSVNPLILTMDTAKSINAVFLPITHMLTTAVEGNGGVVPDSGEFIEDTLVTLTATPESGWRFTHWSGDAEGTDNPVSVTMEADKFIVAHFEEITFSLNVLTLGNGVVSPDSGTFSQGAEVEITAIPDTGWLFSHWSGDVGDSANPITVTMDENKSLTAHFEPMMRSLSVSVDSNGSVSPADSVVAHGTVVRITATSDSGYVFDHWSGDLEGVANPVDVVMDSDKQITAHFTQFVQQRYSLRTVVIGNGAVSPDTGYFVEDTPVEISATPADGWVFSHWDGDVQDTANPTVLIMDTNKTVIAVFMVDNQNVPNSRKIAISARMFDDNNQPVGSDSAVTVGITVRLFDASSAGDVVYTERFDDESGNGIVVQDGYFVTRIGEGETSDDIGGVLSEHENLWVEIQTESETLPRVPLTAAPYSLR